MKRAFLYTLGLLMIVGGLAIGCAHNSGCPTCGPGGGAQYSQPGGGQYVPPQGQGVPYNGGTPYVPPAGGSGGR